MSATARPIGADAQTAVSVVPLLVQWIMDRAAMQYIAHASPAQVEFQFDSGGGGAQAFIARPCWSDHESAPRLTVYAARTGEYVCCSLLTDWFKPDPDPSLWNLDYEVDDAQLVGAPSRV
jgi:hypothetical protein